MNEMRVEPEAPPARGPAGLLEHPCQVVGDAAEMDLVGRIGDPHVRLAKPALDLGREPVLHAADQAGIGDEGVEDETERRAPQLLEHGRGHRIAEHVRVVQGDPHQDVDDPVGIGAIRRPDPDRDPEDPILVRPVHEVAGDELPVGDDHALVIAVDDRRGPDVDPIDLAGGPGDSHHVADPDRPLEQEDDAADEVGDDLLEAEAEPHAEGRHDHPDLGHAQVNGPQGRDRRDPEHHVAAERDDGETYAGVVGNPREEGDGEERAHVSPAQDAEQDHAGRPARSPSVTAVLSAMSPERLVGQESQEREVELPHPGQCERGGKRDRVKQELRRRPARSSACAGSSAGMPASPGGRAASRPRTRDGPRKATAEVRARAQERPGRPHLREERWMIRPRPRWKVQQSQGDGEGLCPAGGESPRGVAVAAHVQDDDPGDHRQADPREHPAAGG